jgi:hypothetical protein
VAQPPIQSLARGGKPVELFAYYDEFGWYYPTCELETKHWFVKNVRPARAHRPWSLPEVAAPTPGIVDARDCRDEILQFGSRSRHGEARRRRPIVRRDHLDVSGGYGLDWEMN